MNNGVSLQHFHTLIMFRQHGNLAFIGHGALDFVAEVWEVRYTDLLTPHPGQSLGPRGCNTRTHRALNAEVARTAITWLRQAHILIGNYHIATDPCKRSCSVAPPAHLLHENSLSVSVHGRLDGITGADPGCVADIRTPAAAADAC